MTSFDHVTFTVSDYARSVEFYDRALAPLGLKRLMDVTADQSGTSAYCGYGDERPFFWIGEGGALTGGRLHVAFSAATRGEVDAFYAAAMAAGGQDNGPPGPRPDFGPDYYAGFVRDPDGHNIEAVRRAAD